MSLVPFASKSFLTGIEGDGGEAGAIHTVEWHSDQGACSPPVLAMMIGGAGKQGISLSLEGRVKESQHLSDR